MPKAPSISEIKARDQTGTQGIEISINPPFEELLKGLTLPRDKFRAAFRRFGSTLGRRTASAARTRAKQYVPKSVAKDITSWLGRDTKRQDLPQIRIGIHAARESSHFAHILEFGTKSENPASPIDDLKPKEGKKGLTVPVTQAAKTAESPKKYPGELTYIQFKRPQRTRQGMIIGAFYDKQELRAAQARGSANLGPLQEQFLLFSTISVKPRFFLQRSVEVQIPKMTESVGKFVQGWVEKGDEASTNP